MRGVHTEVQNRLVIGDIVLFLGVSSRPRQVPRSAPTPTEILPSHYPVASRGPPDEQSGSRGSFSLAMHGETLPPAAGDSEVCVQNPAVREPAHGPPYMAVLPHPGSNVIPVLGMGAV